MNAPLIDKPSTGIDAFHRQRSRCIDAFATIEANVIKRLKCNGAKCGEEPFAQKITTLAATPASPGYAAAAKKKVDLALATLLDLLSVRADIVHSPLNLVSVDSVAHARFVNAAVACTQYPLCRLFSFDQLRELTRRIEELAKELETA